MKKIIIANWKLNPESLKEARKLAKESDIDGLVICPPFPFIEEAAKVLKKAKLGAQDLFWKEQGAYTGEVSATQLKDFGVEYVIIGHSERRQNLGETDETVAKKIAAALKAGLTPILCVGETQTERDAGKTKEVVERQLKIGISLIENCHRQRRGPALKKSRKWWREKFKIENLVIAYEPIWAIGSGTPDTPENMLEMVQFVKDILNPAPYTLNPLIIYGGSVTSKNVKEFTQHREIDGVLVGGASLNAEEIKKIVKIANAR
ncbi:MAG: triose-phosphate isomerase [Patescibacteria group bacterium]